MVRTFQQLAVIRRDPGCQTIPKLNTMWDSFRLTITEPGMIARVGKMNILLYVAQKVEDGIKFTDGTYAQMFVYYTTNSSCARLNEYFFPLCFTIRRMSGETQKRTVARMEFSFWQRDTDSSCLVMTNHSNTKENNFEGNFEDVLVWLLTKIEESLKISE